jgi:hypothetical protein
MRTVIQARLVITVAAAVALAAPVYALDRQVVTSVKPLLVAAIDQGEAHGVLTGPAARYIAQTFRSRAPIEIDVKAVHDLPEPGCKRLAVTTAQDGVMDFNRGKRAAKPSREAFTYKLNFCRDGRMPQGAEVAQ